MNRANGHLSTSAEAKYGQLLQDLHHSALNTWLGCNSEGRCNVSWIPPTAISGRYCCHFVQHRLFVIKDDKWRQQIAPSTDLLHCNPCISSVLRFIYKTFGDFRFTDIIRRIFLNTYIVRSSLYIVISIEKQMTYSFKIIFQACNIK